MRNIGTAGPNGRGRKVAGMFGLGIVLGGAVVAGSVEGIVRFSGAEPPAADLAATPEDALAPHDAEVRLTGSDWDLPNLDHPRVDYWVERFTTDKREEFAGFLSRSGAYASMISTKLAERGMPQDLIYLAMIESGFKPRAYSRAHASGLWQFIRETGERYGLEVNNAVDERNDPEKATDAALDYLTNLHDRFGSWYLAAAGYNTGENRVARIMRQEADYYRIWSRLPRETRDYVPLMVAAARISKEPEKYGFGEVRIEAPLAYDTVTVEPATPLAAIARAADTTVDEIKRLNPHFKLNRTRNDMSVAVRVPVGGAESFATNWPDMRQEVQLASAESTATAESRSYRVRKGDNLTVIARRHGVTIAAIRQENGLRGDRIRAGSTLRIPG
jgi:membrane-bound lytic murein transglycosylase D